MRLIEALRRRLLAEAGLPVIWAGLTIVALIPVWHQRMLPLPELPHDLALARGWHSFHDPAYKIADYYTVHLRPFPPLLFYVAINLLTYVVNIEVASKLFLSAYLILFPLSILALARAFRRTPWLALGGFALAFNQSWIYGLSPFLIGMTLMFFAIAALVRWLNEGKRSHAIWLAVSATLCYFSDLEAWFCFALCALALLVHYRAYWRNVLFAALALVPSIVLAAVQYHSEPLKGATATWHDFPTLVMAFPGRVMELFPGNIDRDTFWMLALAVAGLAAWKGTRLSDDNPQQRRQVAILIGVLLVAYLMLPYEIKKPIARHVSPRLPAMIAPLLLLWPALPATPQQRLWHRLLFVPFVIAAIALPLQLAALYQQFSRRNIPFMHMVEHLPKGSRTLVVVRGMMRDGGYFDLAEDPISSGQVFWHYGSWPMALNGGYSPELLDERTPLVAKTKLAAPSQSEADLFDPRAAPQFEYYVIHGPDDNMERQPSLKIEQRYGGDWVLFKRIYSMTDEP